MSSNVASANDAKIKSEEETFPCLRQAGEGSSSFWSHASTKGKGKETAKTKATAKAKAKAKAKGRR